MKKVLFPTDFSEVATNAFIYALKLANRFDAELIILHVYGLPYVDISGMGVTTNLVEIYNTIELNTFEKLKDQVAILRQMAHTHHLDSVKMKSMLEQGEVITTVREIIKSEQIDFVVMGTKGASGFKETFFGSVTGSVIAKSPVFVLGIPERSEYHAIKNIAFTTRFRKKDIVALKKLLVIAKKFDAVVHCLYVKTSKSDVKEITIQDWKMLFSNENVVFHIVENENVKNSILVFTEVKNIDMLAMLTENRTFFQELFHQSMVQLLSYHVRVPILVLQE